MLELSSLVINARERLVFSEGPLVSVIYFFPCLYLLTFQALPESLRRMEKTLEQGA